MDIIKIAEIIMDDLVLILKRDFGEKAKLCDGGWKSKALMDLKTDSRLWGTKNFAEWFSNFLHKTFCPIQFNFNRKFLRIIHELDQFFPSEHITQAVIDKIPLSDVVIENRILREYMITHDFYAGNIYHVFKLLLQLEDVAEMQEYIPLIQRNVTLEKESSSIYTAKFKQIAQNNIKDLLTPNLDMVVVVDTNKQKRLSSKQVNAFFKMCFRDEKSKTCTGVLKEVNSSSVCIEFNDPIKLKEGTPKYDLVFYSQRYPIRYQYRALELLNKDTKMRNYLFPTYKLPKKTLCFKTELKLINEEIAKNPEQLQAVKLILSGSNPQAPYIIFGPPGTGKTTTIVESILQLCLQNRRSRILVTAGSNSACDTIALRICQYFESSTRLREYNYQTNVLPIIRIFSKSAGNRIKDTMFKDFKQYSNIEWDNFEHAYPAVEDIHKYGIVVATLCTVGKLVCADVGFFNHFTHIFIDEAAASTEPEALVGIMGIKGSSNENCRIILSGDHKQLGPVLKSESAISLGLNVSLMERLLNNECYALDKNGNYDQTFQTRLRRNYRSHGEIVNIYNTLYYNNELLAMKTPKDNTEHSKNWSFLPESSYPIVFQAVHGVTSKKGSTSSCNMLEINVLMWYIKSLIHVDCVDQNDIGIIAPYKLQCQLIRDRLKRENFENIEVGSVEIFQGREKEIIVASMVRSFTNLGFLQNPRRWNVLLSRAKSLLLIIGNPLTLRHYKDIDFVIEKCKENGTYLRKKKIKSKKVLGKSSQGSETESITSSISTVISTKEESPNSLLLKAIKREFEQFTKDLESKLSINRSHSDEKNA